ncbi:mitochondrial inner membrane protease subunit 2 isoform X1 [Parambassis ranga]|uniref:Mitochondrial inner membrane protease subunit 2 n=1 Tax=Parambassis ranga TaxID=210632 RepID=A0A6P7KDX2_9TELE|nr:mitochondrial inner membrane protease subunit 2 isoform X1 [Parambassis ranga]XP_028286507.1 mitochondrial inner membrane protease subunit 2 isoform X1 [Parambassis ranga]
MAQQATAGRRYLRAFVSGFFVSVPVTVTFLDRFAYVARVEGASMQPFLNPEGGSECDVVLLNRWSVRNYQVQRGDIVSVVSPRNPQQKIIKRVIGLEGDFIRTLGYKNRYVRIPDGHFWIEGDHHGHSLDSNSFGPVSDEAAWRSRDTSSRKLYPGVCGADSWSGLSHYLATKPLAENQTITPPKPRAAGH